ncbi:MAG: M50 family metallopeptidase [Bacteroidales bacterium]|nr:M50 family metallopeptidase [Bacteroidales bacterium]
MPSKTFVIIAIILIIMVIRIKNIGIAFRSINTLIHEISHAIMAILMGGSVTEIKLNDNASGSCTTKSKGKFKTFLVSSSGYIFSSLFSYLLFISLGKDWNQYFFYFFLSISVFALIFWIRNTYGIIWTLTFASINLSLILLPTTILNFSNHILLVFGLLIAIDNLLACLSLVYISVSTPKKAGDATNIAKTTKTPAFIWAILFLGFSTFIGYKSYLFFLSSF